MSYTQEHMFVCSLLHTPNYVQQVLVIVNLVVANVLCRGLVEQLLGAGNFRLFDWPQSQAVHRALSLRDEEDMPHAALLEGDSPVRRVIAHWRRNLERPGKLGVDHDLLGGVKVVREAALPLGVPEYVVLD